MSLDDGRSAWIAGIRKIRTSHALAHNRRRARDTCGRLVLEFSEFIKRTGAPTVTATDNFTIVASRWRNNLGGEVANHIAACCNRLDPIHGAITRTGGEVDSGSGDIIVTMDLVNFYGNNLTVRTSLRPTKLEIIPSEEPELVAPRPVGIGMLDGPGDGGAAA
jgi:hypothetical protein